MKAIICADALNAYPDYSKPFHLYTDVTDFQLGSAIGQEHNGILTHITYFSKKLDKAQRKYTATEKELLAIVIVLRAYCKMLSGSRIIIYTDHKNLTFRTFSVQ